MTGTPLPTPPTPYDAGVALAERLVRVLCIAGLVRAAGSAVVEFGGPLLSAWPGLSLSFRSLGRPYAWLFLSYGLLDLGSVVLLAVGAAGELLRRPWARRLLYLYVAGWAATRALGGVVEYVYIRETVSFFQTGGAAVRSGRC
jgi:hypothetical protein